MPHLIVLSLAVVALFFADTGFAASAPSGGAVRRASKVLLFAAESMRPDLLEQYSAQGATPTLRQLATQGVRTSDGLAPAFPVTTGAATPTLATGTWPGEHALTNNTFHRVGDVFNNRASFVSSGILQADTLAAAAERAGKKVAQIEWPAGRNAGIAGPTVDFATFFSTRGVLVAPLNADEQAGAAMFGLSYQVASFAAASGWANVPASYTPAQQSVLTVATTSAPQNPTRLYDLYFYDSINDAIAAYDHVLLVRSGAAKDGSQASASLSAGQFAEIKLTGADGLIGARAGQSASFYLKLVTLAPDLSALKLYFTSISRAIATCSTAACDALPAGGAGENRLEKAIADNLPGYIAADYAPLEAGIIDEDTFMQQALDLNVVYANALIDYILGTLQPNTDLALVGYGPTHEIGLQFLGLVTPTDLDGAPNPFYDNVDGTGGTDGRLAIRQDYLRRSYAGADARLARARLRQGSDVTTIATSEGGIAPQWRAVNAVQLLVDLGLHDSDGVSNCRAGDPPARAKACWTGGTVQIYINVVGRDPDGVVSPGDYESVRDQIINGFLALVDPANPGKQVVSAVFRKESLRNVGGSDSLHPNRSGDVVVVLRPPYQFDAATPGQLFADSLFFGANGYLPTLVDPVHNANLRGVFIAGGSGIRKQSPVTGIRAIDVAPTIAFLLNMPGPHNARGKVLYPLFPSPGRLKETAVLSISDYHGQLVSLTEAADNLSGAGTTNPPFAIGGAAYLKPWFDAYRAEATNGSITVAGGDSVGATPPISHFFGDTPTIEIMNMMGFDADALGNHNFDYGQEYLRTTLIPLAAFPYLSANIVDAYGLTPPEWRPSQLFGYSGGTYAVVGFSNDDLPTLVNPGALDPFHMLDSVAAVSAEAGRLRAKSYRPIIALGHLGATGGTLTNPTGPLADFADDLVNVDAVIGDHTDVQVISTRPNGVLVTENRSRGIRFTRLRIVMDTSTKAVVYKTADYHRPWTIGVTGDAAIAARIDELNSELAALLGVVIGESDVAVPRADACGNGAGRTCESLVGNVVTDAMRTTYATDFAISNSGAFRADLTCPTTDEPFDFCPDYDEPPYLITRGQVLAVVPFGNLVVTVDIDGAELAAMLENSVSMTPSVQGRFPQVSGLCFTYDVSAPAGSRIVGAVRQAANGSCTGAPVDLTPASTYLIAENDFMASGGDGYPDFSGRAATRDYMDQVAADYVTMNSPITPAIQGRIVCTTDGSVLCPVVAP